MAKFARQKAQHAANQRRDHEIADLVKLGDLSLDEIGRMFAKPDGSPLSHQRISQIAKRVAEERQAIAAAEGRHRQIEALETAGTRKARRE